MKSKGSFFAVLATLVLGFASQAQAGLLGSIVDTQYYAYGGPFNGTGSPATFVADGTVQNSFDDGTGAYYNLTVFDTKVQYEFLRNVTWSGSDVSYNIGGLFITNGNLLSFTTAPVITSVVLDGTFTGFTQANVTFDSSHIAVDWQNVTFNQGDKVILNVNAVPEPETYAMLLAGLGLLGSVARRRKLKMS